jgi:Cof subfamily protein (haloacid dehalogenase superfamily)
MIATDLDGTLLGAQGRISPRSVAALQAARQAGMYVVFATGRPQFMVEAMLPIVGDSLTHGIVNNGSVVCSFPDSVVLRSTRFDIDRAVAVVHLLRGFDQGYRFALATDVGFAHQPGFAERMPAPTGTPPTDDVLIAAAGATEAIKLMVFHETYGAHELLALLPTVLDGGLAVSHMGADCVEVGPTGINKATGLAFLCEHLGVDAADVIAFGDEFNDHEMMLWAGHSVAVANAHPATRDLADEVTVSNLDDGVALVIERLLAER